MEGLEVGIKFYLNLANTRDKLELAKPIVISGADYLRATQSISSSAEEVLAIGDVTEGGYLWIVNHDPTNYVELRSATGLQAFARLEAGQFALIPTDAGATYYALANTSACIVEFGIVDA